MINIYGIDGSVILSVPILPECEHAEELMRIDEVRLFWNSDYNSVIPDGAYVIIGSERYSLVEPYSPAQRSENQWRYEPVFISSFFCLGKTPLYMYTYEGGDVNGKIISRESEWTLTDTPLNFMTTLRRAIYNETGVWYDVSVDSSLAASATVVFNSADIISGLNQIAGSFNTEFWLEKYDKEDEDGNVGKIHLSRANDGKDPKVLSVGDNVNVPSITEGGDGYYNRFVILGSSRNITQDYHGAGVNSIATKRLTLDPDEYPDGFMDFSKGGKAYTKILKFDEIYPSATDLVITDVTPRPMYVLDKETNEKIPVGDGYDNYAVWYFRIKRKIGDTYIDFKFDDSTYDKDDNPDGMKLPGLVPSIHFNSGPLRGREFEVIYHKEKIESDPSKNSADMGPFLMEGDCFEVKWVTEGELIIPSKTGLVPADDDLVVLFNVKTPAEYIDDAQLRLKESALKEIGSRYIRLDEDGNPVRDEDGNLVRIDMNSYQMSSNPVEFHNNNPGLKIGSAVRYVNGEYSHDTRVTALSTKLDFPVKQTITIGNERIVGTIRELQEQAANANQNIDFLEALSESTRSITEAYERTQQLIQQRLVDHYYEVDKTFRKRVNLKDEYDYLLPGKGLYFKAQDGIDNNEPDIYVRNIVSNGVTQKVLYTTLPIASEKWISALGVNPGELGGSGGGSGVFYLSELYDVNKDSVLGAKNNDVLTWDGSKWTAKAASGGTVTSVRIGSSTPYTPDSSGVISLPSYPDLSGYYTKNETNAAINSALSSVMKFQGVTTAAVSDGSTNGTVTVDGAEYRANRGDVVLYGNKEFVWTGSSWEELGDEASWALKTVTITGTGYLTGGGSLEANRTIDIADSYKTHIQHGETAYGYFSGGVLGVSHLPSLYVGTTEIQSVSAAQALTGITNITMTGKLKIGKVTIEYDEANDALKVDAGMYSEKFISALGLNPNAGAEGVAYLEDLLDVDVKSKQTGQVLTYRGGKWVAETPQYGFDTSQLASYLTTNGYATQSWVNGRGFITSAALNGYATQDWVSGRGYITSASLTWGNITGKPSNIAYTDSNVASATKLQNSRNLWGQPFNGSADVSGDMTGVGSITASGTIYAPSINGNGKALTIGNYGNLAYVVFQEDVRQINGNWSISNEGIASFNGHVTMYSTFTVKDAVTIGNITSGSLKLGGATFTWDDTNQAIKIDKGFYSESFITAMGIGTLEAGEATVSSLYIGTSSKLNYLTTLSGSLAIYSAYNIYLNTTSCYVDKTGNFTTNYSGTFCTTSGTLNVGTTSSTYKVNVGGAVGATAFNNTSDERLKDITRHIEIGIESIANAPAVAFRWKDGSGVGAGTIAQYWQTLVPEAVTCGTDGILSMQYANIALLSVISVARKVSEHDREIADLKRENAELKKEVERLKAAA